MMTRMHQWAAEVHLHMVTALSTTLIKEGRVVTIAVVETVADTRISIKANNSFNMETITEATEVETKAIKEEVATSSNHTINVVVITMVGLIPEVGTKVLAVTVSGMIEEALVTEVEEAPVLCVVVETIAWVVNNLSTIDMGKMVAIKSQWEEDRISFTQ